MNQWKLIKSDYKFLLYNELILKTFNILINSWYAKKLFKQSLYCNYLKVINYFILSWDEKNMGTANTMVLEKNNIAIAKSK